MKLFRPKRPERPFLKLCEKCHGKGQTSYFDTAQKKKYGPCFECAKHDENSTFGLGVKLKCVCQDGSSSYDWMLSTQAKHLPKVPEMVALQKFQAELRDRGTALLLDCDCGAQYLCIDGGDRRLIAPEAPYNEFDKQHNKDIAQALVEHGIHKILKPGTKC